MSQLRLLGALKDSGGSSDTGGMVQQQVVGTGRAGDTLSGARLVLVVEDDVDVCEVIKYSLLSAGYQVVTAGDGRTGLAHARQFQPDAILLDIMLPEVDGWEVIRALKLAPETAAIPVVMMTAYANRQDRVRGALAGAHYVPKPFDLKVLPGMIANAIKTEPKDSPPSDASR
jgi:DNA-binding response OmpR family regulator